MSRSHEGRTVVISGAAAGIGRALAERLAADGARIVVADLSDAAETIALVERAGSEALGVRCDVSSAEDVAELSRQADARCPLLADEPRGSPAGSISTAQSASPRRESGDDR